jgi:hypothetical protein
MTVIKHALRDAGYVGVAALPPMKRLEPFYFYLRIYHDDANQIKRIIVWL